MIEHRILGPLEVVVDGAVLDLPAAKQRALVCLLLLARERPVSRDELIERLWVGRPPPSAVQTLQSYVANLRRVYEPGVAARDAAVLRSSAGGYVLAAGRLDAARFEQAHATGRARLADGDAAEAVAHLETGLALWRSGPLPELPDDAPAVAEATRLDELRLAAVEDLAEARVRTGQLAVASASLRHLLAEHPLRERARGLLALACYRDGRQADALEVLSEGRRLLAEELGLDPGPELQRLEQAILQQDERLEVRPPADGDGRRAAVPVAGRGEVAAPPAVPLIGREAEFATLVAAVDRGRVVLLSGEAGVGKTRLLTELIEHSRATHLVLQGRCPDAEGVPPHWPWRQVLSGVRGDLETVREVDGPFAVGIAVAERLRLAAREQPLLVVLEDVHWADEASLRILQVVGEELQDSPAAIAASFRAEDAGRPPLSQTLAALARLPAVTRMHLDGLTEPAVAEYVAAVTGAPVSPQQAAVLAERTAGNPFFLGELARLGADVERVPPGVRDVVRLRVARLPDSAVAMLRVGAVLGRDVPVRIATTVAEVDPAGMLDGVDAIVASGLASEPVAGRLRFTHALVREALLEELNALRLAELHGRIADALERTGADPATLAHHRIAAALDGPDERAAAACLVAAERALEELAVEQAAELAAAGARLAPPTAELLRADLRRVEAAARRRFGDLDGANLASEEGMELARRLGDARRFALLVLTRAGGTVQGFWTTPNSGDAALVANLKEAAAGLGDQDPALRARVLAELVVQRRLDGRADEARRTAAEAAEAAALANDRAASIAAVRAAYAAARPQELDEQLGLIDELLALAARRTDVVAAALMMRANLFLASGRVREADEVAGEATALAEEHRLPDLMLLCDSWRIRRRLLVGAWDDAEALSRAMQDRAQHLGPASERLAGDEWTSIRGQLAWQRGGFGDLLEVMEVRSRASAAGWQAVVPLALAEAGRVEEARDAIERVVSPPSDGLPFRALPIQGSLWLTEAVMAVGGHPCADTLLAKLEPYRGQLMVPRFGAGCLGAAAMYTGGLRWALGDLDGAVADLTEAVARHDDVGARPFAARARHRLAVALLDRDLPGDADQAATAWREACEGAEELGMAGLRRLLDDLRVRLVMAG